MEHSQILVSIEVQFCNGFLDGTAFDQPPANPGGVVR